MIINLEIEVTEQQLRAIKYSQVGRDSPASDMEVLAELLSVRNVAWADRLEVLTKRYKRDKGYGFI